MFGRKPKVVEAQAEILDVGALVGKPELVGGYAIATYDYQVEVRRPDQAATRGVARGRACTGCRPEPGDVIAVTCDAKGVTTFALEGDERFVPALVAKRHEEDAVAKDALYGHLEDRGVRGAATVTAVRFGRHRFQNIEVRSDVHVTPKSGEAFDATIVEWIFESALEPTPQIGDKRKVLFDPDDHGKIAWQDA